MTIIHPPQMEGPINCCEEAGSFEFRAAGWVLKKKKKAWWGTVWSERLDSLFEIWK